MHVRTFLSGAAFVVAVAPIAASQVTITPMAGGYIAASDVNQVSSGAQNLVRSRDGTLSLGANIDFGMLRGTFAYASGTTIKSASNWCTAARRAGPLGLSMIVSMRSMRMRPRSMTSKP